MIKLIKLLKPYKLLVLVIMALHVVRVYTTLLLPDFTSNLIDTGIQNGGIEYAVPLAMTQEDGDLLRHLLLPNEVDAFDQAYMLTNGEYRLQEHVSQNRKALANLSHDLTPVLVVWQNAQQMTETARSQLAFADSVGIRSYVNEILSKVGENVVNATAKKATRTLYERAGGDVKGMQMAYLFKTGWWMLLVSLIAMLSAFGAHFFAARIGAAIGHQLRTETFEKVMAFSQQEMNQFSTASLITRSTNDVQQIQVMMIMFLRIVLFSPLMAFGALIHVMNTKVSMVWIVGLAIAIVMSVVGVLMSVTMPKFKLLQKQVDRVNLFAREILTGLQVIRAYGRQSLEAERFDGASIELRDTNMFTNRVMSLMMPSMMLIMNGISILIIWVASHQIAEGMMQVGEMTAFINYAMQIIFSFLMLTMISVQLPRAIVSVERINEVLDAPLTIADPPQSIEMTDVKGIVSFEHVGFRYEQADADTLQDISFTALPGQTTAIIGSTGSGKSTILNLLMRFYDVTQGRITIDGYDIRQVSQAALRDVMGYVPQKGVLFSGTIASNIRYGNRTLSEADLVEASDIAHATEFIQAKEQGYQSEIAQGGSNVSGGQKQRLSIARAIAKQPKIFLFDDSFSALDYRTDASLRQALREKTNDATVLIVAQRVSTILNADQIIVLDEGRIAGIGTHQQLMRESSVYREIAMSQLSEAELERYSEEVA